MYLLYHKILFFIILPICCFFLFSCSEKRTTVSYELPKDYVGWVTVKYEKPNAPPLELVNGKYHIKISPSGIAETSSKVENGFAEDEYYWMDGDKKVVLQQYSEDQTTMIHGDNYASVSFQIFAKLDTLPIGKEITLPDGGKVTRLDDKGGVSIKSGRFLLYHFYVSWRPESIDYFNNNNLPALPPEQQTW